MEQILKGKFDGHIEQVLLFTFMFNHIPGDHDHKCSVMENPIERIYATLIRHVVRDPRSQSNTRLPMLYAFPDYPGNEIGSVWWEDITSNDGLSLSWYRFNPHRHYG